MKPMSVIHYDAPIELQNHSDQLSLILKVQCVRIGYQLNSYYKKISGSI